MLEGELIGIAMVYGFMIKLPRPPQENMASFHWDHIT